jgi:hypothetical protein
MLAVQAAAQSWEGLAPEESERTRLAATAAGGVVVMRRPDPEPLCRLAGSRKVIETGRKIIAAGRYGDEGTGRVQQAWVADPDRVRNFRAAWIHGNACTYVLVAPYRRSPLPLPAVTRQPSVPLQPWPVASETGTGSVWRAGGSAAGRYVVTDLLDRAAGADDEGGRGVDAFGVLGLPYSPDLDDEDVRRAYLYRLKAVHPDNGGDERVRTGGADLALIGAAGALPGGLEALTLVSDGLVAAVPPGHPLAGRRAVTMAEVTGYPIVSLPTGTGVRAVFDQPAPPGGSGRTSPSRPAPRGPWPTWLGVVWAWPSSPRPWRPGSQAG